jgi:hypothetical protein
MPSSVVLPIHRRFVILSILGVLGAILFVPSIEASADPKPSIVQLSVFVAVVSVIGVLSALLGLRCADATALPMPYLRRLDHGKETPPKHGFLVSAIFGVLFALATIAMLRMLHVPNLAGPLWSRVASVFFAAGSLELVLHLFIMSMVVKIAGGRRWIGILVAALFFVLFHASGLPGQSATVVILTLLMNGIFALGLGIIYARFGFEYVLFCHAVGHLLAVSVG